VCRDPALRLEVAALLAFTWMRAIECVMEASLLLLETVGPPLCGGNPLFR
jgi:hypothetical protein